MNATTPMTKKTMMATTTMKWILIIILTLAKEDDTVEDVSRDADAEDDGIEVAEKCVLYGAKRLNGDDVIGVVPRNEVVYVTIAFAAIIVQFNFHYRRHCIRDLARASPHRCYFMF